MHIKTNVLHGKKIENAAIGINFLITELQPYTV